MAEDHYFDRAAVAAPHGAAVEAGRAVLGEGGHAIEAMIAMAATIAVVYPHMNSIGGDGFWLIRDPRGEVRYIEACGPAGSLAKPSRYRDLGHDAVPPRGPDAALTVPGTVGGWMLAHALAHEAGARLPLRDLLGDAIRHAREGYRQSKSEARSVPFEFEALKQAPGFARAYLDDGKLPPPGTLRKAETLSGTLEQLAHAGLDDFYRGDVAHELAADMEMLKTCVTRADLEAYRACFRRPLVLRLMDRTYYNAPPPTQGLASLVLLGIYDRLGASKPESFAQIHGLIEAAKRALAIRDLVCTDFERLKHRPLDLLTPSALQREADAIDMARAASFPVKPAAGDTVWMGAMDAKGWTVSFIQSIFWEYGSGCVLPRTGVLLQNRGSSFSLDPVSVNPLSPGRRPFHTLNPPLAVFDDGRVVSYGSMGGDGQPQFQAQVFARLLFGESVAASLDGPRFLFGKTWGTATASLKLEPRFDDGLVRDLRSAGHEIELSPLPYSETFGHAGALVRRPNGRIEAGHDPRSDGGAGGF